MLASETHNSDLIGLLHAGLFETPMWHMFLERLRQRTRADHCAIIFRRGDAHATEATAVSAGDPMSSSMRRRYVEKFHKLDPVPYDQLRVGRVYALSEFMLPGNREHDQYRRDYMLPGGMNFKRIMRVSGESGYNAWLTIWSRQEDFGGSAASILTALAPHISIALRTLEHIERNRIRVSIADEVNRLLSFGWLTLDAGGHIVEIDPEAARLLEATTGQKPIPTMRLSLADGAAERILAETLGKLAENQVTRPRAVRLGAEPSLDLLLAPMRERALSGARTPVLIAYVHGDNSRNIHRVDQLMDLFGLTRSEARIALTLARGRSMLETAKELSLTIETTRTYSKRIYNKLGARGQPDLVRIVLASIVALV